PQQVFIKDVPIIVTSPEPDLILMSEIPETANVNVQTTRERLAELSAATVRAEVDLENRPAGVHRVPVEVTLADERAQLMSVVPDFINVALEQEISVEVTPTVKILDPEALPFGYTLGEVSVSPEIVVLIGPESLVEEVVEVRAELTLNGNRTDFQESLLVIPLDENGSWVEDVRIMPAEVLARVPIEHTEFTRQVPIQANLRADTLEDGYEITSVRMSPTSLTLTGPRTALESVGDFILTAPITLTNVYSELTLDVPLILPEGVVGKGEKGENVDSAVVSIFVSPQTNYLLQTVPPIFRGLPLTYSAEMSPQQVSVLLIGPQPILDEIEANPSLVQIYMDVTDLPLGTHVLPLEYEAPSGISVELFPSEVQVTIREEPES
ncbi:YbbR-like domain-containing protein, partial [Chloroflexota bacterium]